MTQNTDSFMHRRRIQCALRWLAGHLEPHMPRSSITISNSTVNGVPGMTSPVVQINQPPVRFGHEHR